MIKIKRTSKPEALTEDVQIQLTNIFKKDKTKTVTHRGYKQVDVCNDEGIKKHMRVHRLVYMAHKGVIPEGMQINHKDENKANNCIDNLELMTNKENWKVESFPTLRDIKLPTSKHRILKPFIKLWCQTIPQAQ